MSNLKVDKIEVNTGSNLVIGTGAQTLTVNAAASFVNSTGIKTNTISGIGANTINVTTPFTVGGATLAGRRNLIINGAMQVAQYGGSSTTVNSSTETFSVDRFFGRGVGSAGVFTVEQSTTAPDDFINSSKVTVTTADSSIASTDAYQFTQRIEGKNSYWLNWGSSSAKTVTLSFYVRSSLTGTFGGCIRNSAFDRFYPFSYTISSADTWERKTVVIDGDTTGTWLTTNGIGVEVAFSLGAGSSRVNTAGSWTASTSEGATGQVNLISTISSTWYITGVQLEVGTVATPFEHAGFGDELQRCQRYYYQLVQGSYMIVGMNDSTSNCETTFGLPVEMRVDPTLGTSGTASEYTIRQNGSNIICDSVPTILGGGGKQIVGIRFTKSAALNTSYASYCFGNTSGADLKLDAEL